MIVWKRKDEKWKSWIKYGGYWFLESWFIGKIERFKKYEEIKEIQDKEEWLISMRRG